MRGKLDTADAALSHVRVTAAASGPAGCVMRRRALMPVAIDRALAASAGGGRAENSVLCGLRMMCSSRLCQPRRSLKPSPSQCQPYR